jgi:hypothetical protein
MIFYAFMLSIAITSSAQLTPSYDVVTYESLFLSVALSECPFVGNKDISLEFLSSLLAIEKKAGVPVKYRGMVLAAACSESGYNLAARGDSGKAVGILQMWPWWEKKYGVDRLDPYASARAWTAQIMRAFSRAKKKCGRKKAFVSAWAWVASGPKGWRCRAPRHYSRLKRWQKIVKKMMSPVPS